ncbi:diacylglycerol/lipid kinase family protein [Chryseosolibacter indicus]|uniref:NAD(+)/NADH kinase n=1 Tax=Chryseosolibacter indicus TaxID=2782351 RepID=A0ABS5VPJ5_9BACT|nr:diacylglycerol kinase family protein [Chryseosolibacter indicus]MBT1703362.1 NAD(+)/NADH kinase [Chryseosolibacter indicus]
MKCAKLLHNPGAGDGEHSMKDLAKLIKDAGYECSYSSTKALIKPTIKPDEIDFVVLAGGDGTVRKIARQLLDENLPIGLLPMGTANNIAKTLGLNKEVEEIIKSWDNENIKSFDVGRIHGFAEDKFFLEGFGYGVFPQLMKEMKKQNKESIEDPQLKLKAAVELLYEVVQGYKAVDCDMIIGDKHYHGRYLLVEAMNIQSIGPNILLAPHADPGDGKLEVVMIEESQRDELLHYLRQKIEGKEIQASFTTVKSNSMKIHWHGDLLHIDDEKVKIDQPTPLTISIENNALQFLVPNV